MEIDITGCTESVDYGLVNTDSQGVTETSSSFGETLSGTESVSTLNDIEVDSPCDGGNTLAPEFDGYNKELPIRKKKLTDHWRRFIHPIKWRSKWIELKIKELHSQALKYHRELAEYGHRKQLEFENHLVEGCGAKSLPLNCQVQKNHVMERRKRKRVEDTADMASYMSFHNIFSYHEIKKSMADGAFLDNYCSNLGNKTVNGIDWLDINDGWQSLTFRNGDNPLEQMLWKIDMLQSQVCKLKARVDKVVSESPGKFCSVNKLSVLVPCNALNCSDENDASTENGNGIL